MHNRPDLGMRFSLPKSVLPYFIFRFSFRATWMKKFRRDLHKENFLARDSCDFGSFWPLRNRSSCYFSPPHHLSTRVSCFCWSKRPVGFQTRELSFIRFLQQMMVVTSIVLPAMVANPASMGYDARPISMLLRLLFDLECIFHIRRVPGGRGLWFDGESEHRVIQDIFWARITWENVRRSLFSYRSTKCSTPASGERWVPSLLSLPLYSLFFKTGPKQRLALQFIAPFLAGRYY